MEMDDDCSQGDDWLIEGYTRDPQFPSVIHNGYCWQYEGDAIYELGWCMNPECRDPMLDPDEDRTRGLTAAEKRYISNGRYWGSFSKTITCTCGAIVHLS